MNPLAKFLLIHRHDEGLCQAVYDAWAGWESTLLPSRPPETCRRGGHTARWITSADDANAALDLLPPLLGERTEVFRLD